MTDLYHLDSPLGGITLAGDTDALAGLWFDGQKHFGRGLEETRRGRMLPVFEETIRWLDVYFSGRDPGFLPKLRPVGTMFQHAVWEKLLQIPYGQTRTYGEISAMLTEWRRFPPVSARAIGGAVARNPVSLIIPCHRVVGADGSLTGYAGGLSRKERLLRLEKTGGMEQD